MIPRHSGSWRRVLWWESWALMSAFKRLILVVHDRKLPTEIYTSLVASLFSDPRTLIIGGFGSITAALVIAWRTAEPTLIFCAAGLIAITLARAWDMRAFARRAETTMSRATAIRWELRYVVGASAYVALLGAWCFFAFARTVDPVVQLLTFSTILVNMIGVAGRNFGSKLLVNAQLVCAAVPMTLALFLVGGTYYAVSGCVLVPFFV